MCTFRPICSSALATIVSLVSLQAAAEQPSDSSWRWNVLGVDHYTNGMGGGEAACTFSGTVVHCQGHLETNASAAIGQTDPVTASFQILSNLDLQLLGPVNQATHVNMTGTLSALADGFGHDVDATLFGGLTPHGSTLRFSPGEVIDLPTVSTTPTWVSSDLGRNGTLFPTSFFAMREPLLVPAGTELGLNLFMDGSAHATGSPDFHDFSWVHMRADYDFTIAAVVPEPSTAVLLLMGIAGLPLRRRSQHVG